MIPHIKLVFLLCIWCQCYVDGTEKVEHISNGYAGETLGNLMGFSWKLPKDGGGGDSQCEKDIRRMYSSLNNMTLWAFQMWEATAGETSGWATGSIYQLGNFDECLGDENPGMERQYCVATVNIKQHPKHPPIHTYVNRFDPYASVYDMIYYNGNPAYLRRDILYWGICSPASCSYKELQELLQKHIDKSLLEKGMKFNGTNSTIAPNIGITLPEFLCQKRKEPEPFSSGALVFIWLVGLSGIAVCVASVYHCYLIYRYSDSDTKCPKIVEIYSAIGHMRRLKGNREHGSERNGMECLWGLRFLSIFFVICGHRFGSKSVSAVYNRDGVERQYHRVSSMFVSHGDAVVDTYFAISGVLSIHGILKNNENADIKKYPLMILYRYIRLVPAYAMVIMFSVFILPLTGSSPMWPFIVEKEARYCRENWWINLLMLNNYIQVERMCMTPSWFVACDFHFFLLSLGICALFNMKSRPYTVLSGLSILIVVAILIPAVITYTMKLPGLIMHFYDYLLVPRDNKYFQYIYITSHTRAATYLIGILTGYIILRYHVPGKKQLSTILTTVGGFISVGILFGAIATAAIFYEPSYKYSVLDATFYAAFQRPIWAAAVCFIIICCVFGEIPFISSFLGWSVWVPFGKLVYGAYLIHLYWQIRSECLPRNAFYFDRFTVMGEVFGDSVVAFCGSLLLHLLFEGPIRNIVDTLLSTKIKPPRRHSVTQNSFSTASPTAGNDNKALELDAVETAELKNNFTEMKTFGKFDRNLINKDNFSKTNDEP